VERRMSARIIGYILGGVGEEGGKLGCFRGWMCSKAGKVFFGCYGRYLAWYKVRCCVDAIAVLWNIVTRYLVSCKSLELFLISSSHWLAGAFTSISCFITDKR
jgi:hypothetical protein